MLGNHKKRAKQIKLTPEKQRKVNERKAINTLTWALNENFGVGDAHMVLTYRKEYTPSPEQARRDLEKFLRMLRKWCRESGKELRYITVT